MIRDFSVKVNTFLTIIKLILNEILKIGVLKFIFCPFLFLAIIMIIYCSDAENINGYAFTLIPFVGILMIILFGGSISSEIEHGSLKYYLTKPVKRWKVYLSKLLCVYLFITIMFTYILFVFYVINNGLDKAFTLKYCKYIIPVYLMGSIMLCISSIFKNTSLCIGLDIMLLVFSGTIAQVFFGLDMRFIQYSFLPYMDFNTFNDMSAIKAMNKELGIDISLKKGMLIDTIYIYIFYYIGKNVFINKDIKS